MEQHLYELLRQCTVRVSIPGKTGHGTGFFVAPGLILTCAHVIKATQSDPSQIEIYWREQSHPAQITNLQHNQDLSLLQVNLSDHPCVYLHEEALPFDALYSYGYPDNHPNGDPATFTLEGKVGEQGEQLKFKVGQVRPGLSGAPLLNMRTGYVCGVVQLTRDRNNDLGGRAIPAITILRVFPDLVVWQEQFHSQNNRWTTSLELMQANTTRVEFILGKRLFGELSLHHQPERCDYYAHISLPTNYIERIEVLAAVRTKLLSEASSVALTSELQVTKPNALHGMGGIGKTIIARALCDDPVVQTAFPDGILWVTLGQTPALIPKLRELVNVLGGTINEKVSTIDSLKVILARLLKNRTCLLILDDVWRRTDANVFCIGGPQCRLLLTTRDAEIARGLGAKVEAIPVMTEAEAIALLEEWADGQITRIDANLKGQIVKRLGYLPLAVRLAGAQLQHKPPYEWLRTFEVHKLKFRRPEDIHDDLELTFRLSLDELSEEKRHLYTTLSIFKEDEEVPQAVIERLWEGLRTFVTDAIVDLIDDLAARALLEVINYPSSRAIRLHDLLRDLISTELGGNGRIKAHKSLLNMYRTTCKGTGWHTTNDDGYLYNHLTYHLYASNALDELKGLFADQYWLYVRVPQRDYTYDGYLEDLSFAWKSSETEIRRQIETNQEPYAFVDCIRYLLIGTSINSIAGNYVPQLVAHAVKLNLWTTRRALSVAAKIPDSAKQIMMYIALLQTEKLSKEQRKEVQRLGLELSLALPEREQAQALMQLVPYLEEDLLKRVLEIAPIFSGRLRVQVLIVLAQQLSGEQRFRVIQKSLETAITLSKWEQAEALIALAQQLSGEQHFQIVQKVLEVALILSERKRAQVLIAVASQLIGEQLDQALNLASELSNWEQTQVLAALAPELTPKQRIPVLNRALEVTLTLPERLLTKGLVILAPQLLKEQLDQALNIALEVKDEMEQALVLAALASYLPEKQCFQAVHKSLKTVLTSSEPERERVQVLIMLATLLTEEQMKQALEATFNLHERERAQMLALLVPQMAGPQRILVIEEALKAALIMKDNEEREIVLSTLAPNLTAGQIEQALEAALTLPREEREQILATLTFQDSEEQHLQVLTRVLKAALTFPHEEREQILATLPFQVAGEKQLHVLKRMLEAALAFPERFREQVFVQAIKEALEVVRTLPKLPVEKQAQVLAALAPQLSAEQRFQAIKEVLITVLALPMQTWVEVLAALAPYLTTGQLEQAQERSLILSVEEREQILAALPFQATKEQHLLVLERALEAALTLPVWECAQMLIALAPQLTGKLMKRALEGALTLPIEIRAEVLVALVPQLSAEQRFQAINEALITVLALPMQKWAEVLAALAPYLTTGQLEQAQFSAQRFRGWEQLEMITALAPYLATRQLERMLDIMRRLPEEEQAKVQMTLASELKKEKQPTHSFEKALKAALALPERWRARALIVLAPQLLEKQLDPVLKAAFEVRDEVEQALVLAALARHLSGIQLDRALKVILTLPERQRVQVLALLPPGLMVELLEQILVVTLAHLEKKSILQVQASFPLILDQALILKSIRQAIIDDLLFIQNWSRQRLLRYFFTKEVFTPPIFSSEILRIIASHIIEICERWKWL